ncbi:MAG: SRPBCC domain-containing protein [Sphingomonas sp.]|uniref:SRPBCC family protein n=1 Tax=Sphingomonas sp. TaxID=28214 RepID=UPI0035A832E8|nr:SRPBCC domain-containing protein [Sphingomonas sp.]
MATARFTITRTFAASRNRVWAAWTEPEQLAAWFGPKDSAGSILAFDLRPGGEWRGRMEAPDGAEMFSKFVFQVVEPCARLVWVHGFADAEGNRARAPFAPLFPLEMLTTVLFSEAEGGTRIDLSWEPIDATPEECAFFAEMMASMTGGWSGSFDQLDALFAE